MSGQAFGVDASRPGTGDHDGGGAADPRPAPMRLSVLDTDELSPDTPAAWRSGASRHGAGILFVHGPIMGIAAPSDTVAAWCTRRYGADAALLTELAGFVYHRKGWFADDLDPLALRDRRPGQYELRVFTEIGGRAVPLLAIDFAPVRGAGTWSELDQTGPNRAASILEIGVVPGDQEVVTGGAAMRLADVDCRHDRVWEASRLAAVTELLRNPARASEAGVPAFRRLDAAAGAVAALERDEADALADAAKGMFGVCLSWLTTRLPVDLVIGLSQGNVVPAFTASIGARRALVHRPVQVARWHTEAEALRYAPGYFATGEVCGYALDGTGLRVPAMARGLTRLGRAPVGRTTDVLAGLYRSA